MPRQPVTTTDPWTATDLGDAISEAFHDSNDIDGPHWPTVARGVAKAIGFPLDGETAPRASDVIAILREAIDPSRALSPAVHEARIAEARIRLADFTCVLVVCDAMGRIIKLEAEAGDGPHALGISLAHGDGVPYRHALIRVERQDFAAGTMTDATADTLHAVAAECDAAEVELPAGLADLFDLYGVPRPQSIGSADRVDPNAEHRPTAADLGISARAA